MVLKFKWLVFWDWIVDWTACVAFVRVRQCIFIPRSTTDIIWYIHLAQLLHAVNDLYGSSKWTWSPTAYNNQQQRQHRWLQQQREQKIIKKLLPNCGWPTTASHRLNASYFQFSLTFTTVQNAVFAANRGPMATVWINRWNWRKYSFCKLNSKSLHTSVSMYTFHTVCN